MTLTTSLIEKTTTWTDFDRRMMTRALELAQQGIGLVSPGPLVGCVVVDARGLVVGEGHYEFEGVKHAETLALAEAGDKARGGTAYVSLEPHAHYGRTPPCTDALISAGIKRVVAPIQDLNPKVSGKGLEHLVAAGIEVQTGLLSDEAEKVNEAYLHFMKTGRPFVHLKMAVTLDGKIATRTGDSRWIGGPESRARAHDLRHQYDAILVGAGTAKIDDPLLTDRSERSRRRQLVRVVVDDRLELSSGSQLAKTARDSQVLVFACENASSEKASELESKGVEIVCGAGRDIKAVLQELGKRAMQSVLVEGGATLAGQLVDARLVNKVTFFVAPKIVGGREASSAVGGRGVELMRDALELAGVETIQRGNDVEITGYPQVVAEK